MPPRKKAATVVFLPDSCGACTFCVEEKGEHYCCAMPPSFAGQDEEGYAVSDRLIPCEESDPPCIYFKPRCNA